MSKLSKLLIYLLSGLICIIVLGFYIRVSDSIPEYALVYVDTYSNIYYAPPCVKDSNGLVTMTLEKVHLQNIKPDKDCVNSGVFQANSRSLIVNLLENIGILQPPMSRWNSDGTWNW